MLKLSIGETVKVVMSSPMGGVAWIVIPEPGRTRATVQAGHPDWVARHDDSDPGALLLELIRRSGSGPIPGLTSSDA